MVHLFNHPVPSTLLLALAFLGIVAEVRSDGLGRAGIAGVLALALFFLTHLAEGGWIGSVPLALLGLVVLRPALRDPRRRWSARVGLGFTAAGAFLCMISLDPETLALARALAVMASAALLVLLVGLVLWVALPASARPSRRMDVFFPDAPSGATSADAGVHRGEEPGRRGRALTPLRPGGLALFGDRRVEVASDGPWIDEGTPVEVVDAARSRTLVRAVSPPESEPGSVEEV